MSTASSPGAASSSPSVAFSQAGSRARRRRAARRRVLAGQRGRARRGRAARSRSLPSSRRPAASSRRRRRLGERPPRSRRAPRARRRTSGRSRNGSRPARRHGMPAARQRRLEQALGVGAGEHGLVRTTARRGGGVAHGPGDGAACARRPSERWEPHRRQRALGTRRRAAARPRRAEHGVGDGEDLRRRAVVVVEARPRRPGKCSPKLGEERRRRRRSRRRSPGCGSPTTHRSASSPSQPSSSAELQRVDVLELVDEQVAEAPALGGGELGVVLEGVGAQRSSRSSKSTRPRGALLAPRSARSSAAIGVGGERRGRRPAARGLGLVALGRDEPGLGPLDLGGEVDALDAGVAPTCRGSSRASSAHLALEQRRRRDAAVGPAPAQLGVGDGVERAGGDAVAQAERARAGRAARRPPCG